MPQFRKDPLSGRWVIIAEERANRPVRLAVKSSAECPFCPGNETSTPEEVDSFRPKHGTARDWKVRVVPNKYPAVQRDPQYQNHRSFRAKYGRMLDVDEPFEGHGNPEVAALPGVGSHEVIIDTPRHVRCLSEMTDKEIQDMLLMYRKRLRTIGQDKSWAHVLVFKNVGEQAGATIHHSHSQLLAMPFLPPPIQRELFRAIEFRRQTDLCYWCAHIESERQLGIRLVTETKRFVLLCPYLSRFPMETAIFPKEHVSHFERLDDMAIVELAQLVKQMVVLLTRCNSSDLPLSYNMVLKSGPFYSVGPPAPMSATETGLWFKSLDYSLENAYHFHLAVYPALSRAAGFEWGSGLHINSTSPETAAQRLRDVI